MMISQNFQFQVSYCNSTERKLNKKSDCHPKPDIDKYIRDIQIDLWAAEYNIDYDVYNTAPVFVSQKVLKTTLLDPAIIQRTQVSLVKHSYQTQDDYIQYRSTTLEGKFYQVSDTVFRPMRHNSSQFLAGVQYVDQFYLKPKVIMHSREIYHFLDLLGDLGGVSSIFIMVIGFFIYPISQQAFYLRMMKQIFMADLFCLFQPEHQTKQCSSTPQIKNKHQQRAYQHQ